MEKSRLRIGFDHLCCRTPSSGPGAPTIKDHEPAPGLIDFLLRETELGQVTVYPLEPGPGRAPTIQHWLWVAAIRYFERHDHPNPKDAADRLIDIVAVTGLRPPDGVSMEMDSVWYPGGAWPTSAEIDAAVDRVADWRGIVDLDVARRRAALTPLPSPK